MPWVALAELPTPVERLTLDGTEVWVKRDDVSATPYGGNKVRKLEFLLGEAVARGAEEVITFGAAGSNHALATAVYGSRLGLRVTLLLTAQPNNPHVAPNLLADRAFGAELHHFADAPRAVAAARALTEAALADDVRLPYVIPFGGTTPLSAAGLADAGLELAAQIESGSLPEPDAVYVAAGSMGTVAGVAIGLALAGCEAEVRAVRVTPETIASAGACRDLIRDAVDALREYDRSVPDVAGLTRVRFIDDQYGDGYAVPTEAGLAAVRSAAGAGVQLETTYTGKALAALLADARTPGAGRTFVFWDTCNSRDLSEHIARVTPEDVPPEFRAYFSGDAS